MSQSQCNDADMVERGASETSSSGGSSSDPHVLETDTRNAIKQLADCSKEAALLLWSEHRDDLAKARTIHDQEEMQEAMRKLGLWTQRNVKHLLEDMRMYEEVVGTRAPPCLVDRLQDDMGNMVNLRSATTLVAAFEQRWAGAAGPADLADLYEWVLEDCLEDASQSALPSLEASATYDELSNAFASAFRGDAAGLLAQTLERNTRIYSVTAYYGKILLIPQSSGTGKSRLVYETRLYWPVLTVTFRKSDMHDVQKGYPLADVEAQKYFEGNSSAPAPLVVTAFVAAWLAQAASTVNKDARDMASIWSQAWDHVDASSLERNKRNKQRHAHFGQIRNAANGMVKRHSAPEIASDPNNLVETLIREPLAALTEALSGIAPLQAAVAQSKLKQPLLVLAVDECTVFDRYPPGTLLTHLRRCVRLIDELLKPRIHIWLVLMDTSSSVGQLLSREPGVRSARELQRNAFEPFVKLPIDLFVDAIPQCPSPGHALALDTLKLYGRPLWRSYPGSSVIPFAAMKLGTYLDSDNLTSGEREVRAIALLSHRVCLDIVPLRSNRSSWIVSRDSVDSHMRFLKKFIDTDFIETTAASEPALALASWYLLSNRGEHPHWTWSAVLEVMASGLMFQEFVDLKGLNGEFFCRVLLTLARDASSELREARSRFPASQDQPISSIPAIDLSSFLRTLLGESSGSLAMSQLAENVDAFASARRAMPRLEFADDPDTPLTAGRDSQQRCHGRGSAKAYLNFTHMITADSYGDTISPLYLWRCWKRGLAIQCHANQRGIDGILPIYMGSLDDALDSEEQAVTRMSYVAWQSKYRQRSSDSNTCLHGPLVLSAARLAEVRRREAMRGQNDMSDVVDSDRLELEEGAKPPLFTILFDLGVTDQFGAPTVSRCVTVVRQGCLSGECRALYGEGDGLRIPALKLRGCDADLFPFLKAFDGVEEAFAKMYNAKQRKKEAEVDENRWVHPAAVAMDEGNMRPDLAYDDYKRTFPMPPEPLVATGDEAMPAVADPGH